MKTRHSAHYPVLFCLACASMQCTVSREFSQSAQRGHHDLPCGVLQSLPLDQREFSLSAQLQKPSAQTNPRAPGEQNALAPQQIVYHLTNASLAATHPLSYLCEVAVHAQKTPAGYHLRNAGVRLTRQPLEGASHAHLMLAVVRQAPPREIERAQASAASPLPSHATATQRLRGIREVEVIPLTQRSLFDSFPSAPKLQDSRSVYRSYASHIHILARAAGWNGFSVYQWTLKNGSEAATIRDSALQHEDQLELALVADALLGELADGPVSSLAALSEDETGSNPAFSSTALSFVPHARFVQTAPTKICEATGCPAQVQALFQAYWPALRRRPASLRSDAGDYLVSSFSIQGYTPEGSQPSHLEDLLKTALDQLDKTHQLRMKLQGLRSALRVLEESP